MRLLPLAATALLLLLAVPATEAHEPRTCRPPLAFPSAAAWFLDPGESLVYTLPANQFGAVASATPINITLYPTLTCEVDPNCHHHGATGTIVCGTYRHAAFEIVNAGPDTALVFLAIGQCGHGIAC